MGYIYSRPGKKILMMQYSINGRRIRESTGTEDRKKAQKVLNARETDGERGLPVGPKVGKLKFERGVELMRVDYANNNRKSWKDKADRIRLHLAPAFGGWKMADIQVHHIEKNTADRREEGAEVGTVARELDILRRIFTLAVQRGLLLHAPHIPSLDESGRVRSGFFEAEAFLSVRRHLPEPLRAVATLAYVTGWRVESEILPLEWRQVAMPDGEFRLDPGQTKNGKPRVFRMSDDLRNLFLDRLAARNEMLQAGYLCPWVFWWPPAKGRHAKQKYPRRIKSFEKSWESAVRLAGVPGRIVHDFRRTAIRNMVRRNVTERVAMQLTGHLTRNVFDRYNIVSEGDLVMAAERLEGLAPADGPANRPAAETATLTATPQSGRLTSSRMSSQKVREIRRSSKN